MESVPIQLTSPPGSKVEATVPGNDSKSGTADALPAAEVGSQSAFTFTDFPPEILGVILSYVYAIELLNLARANKALRRILLSRTARPWWKTALKNLGPLLPACPENMSEPEYTHCIFRTLCQFCGRDWRLTEAWDFRFHVCEKCLQAHPVSDYEHTSIMPRSVIGMMYKEEKEGKRTPVRFEHQYAKDESMYSLGEDVKRIDPENTPCVTHYEHGPTGKPSYYVFLEERKRHTMELESLPTDAAREVYEAEKLAALQAWREVKLRKDIWRRDFDERDKALNKEIAKIFDEHKDRLRTVMKGRLSEKGWAREFRYNTRDLWDIPAWERIGEPLTESVWEELEPKLVRGLKLLRLVRIDYESMKRLSAAMHVLKDLREEFADKHDIMPHNGDLFRMGPIQDTIFNVFHQPGHMDPDEAWEKEEIRRVARKVMQEQLGKMIEEWIVVKKRDLYSIVVAATTATDSEGSSDSKSAGGADKPKPTIPDDAAVDATLNLATSVFHLPTTAFVQEPSRYTAILGAWAMRVQVRDAEMRPDTNPLNVSQLKTKAERDRTIRDALLHMPFIWSPRKAEYFKEFVPIIECIVRGLGLDPAVATYDEMKNRKGVRFRCGHKTCYKRYFAPISAVDAIEHWVQHYQNHRKSCEESHREEFDWGIEKRLAPDVSFLIPVSSQ